MAEVTAALIKELRVKTSAGMIDCKKALIECDGDMEKATEFLRKKGLASAGKRAGRDAKEGVITTLLKDSNKYGVMLEFNCETDFVAKNEDFISLAETLTEKISEAGTAVTSSENLPADITEMISNAIATNGENMSVGQISHFKIEDGKEGAVASYIHSNKKIGVMVQLDCEAAGASGKSELVDLGKEIAMHAAATAPQYIAPADVPEDIVSKEKEIFLEQMKDSGKPENVLEKIIEGKIRKYFTEVCLLEQEFVKDSAKKIKDLIKDAESALGGNITLANMSRFQIGG